MIRSFTTHLLSPYLLGQRVGQQRQPLVRVLQVRPVGSKTLYHLKIQDHATSHVLREMTMLAYWRTALCECNFLFMFRAATPWAIKQAVKAAVELQQEVSVMRGSPSVCKQRMPPGSTGVCISFTHPSILHRPCKLVYVDWAHCCLHHLNQLTGTVKSGRVSERSTLVDPGGILWWSCRCKYVEMIIDRVS